MLTVTLLLLGQRGEIIYIYIYILLYPTFLLRSRIKQADVFTSPH